MGLTDVERIFPVFQDEKELPTSADLGSQIADALEQSRFLIVLCSPTAATSRWVNQEVLRFKQLGRADHVFAVILEGEPSAGCFPPALRVDLDGVTPVEPLAADFRKNKSTRTTPADPENAHDREFLRIVAGLLGVGFDTLAQRDQERRLEEARRRAARLRRLVVAFALLGLAAAGAAVLAAVQWREADRQREIVVAREAEVNRTFSRSDFHRAAELAEARRYEAAMAHLARAIRSDPQNLAAGRRLLFLLMQHPWFIPHDPGPAAPDPVGDRSLVVVDSVRVDVVEKATNRVIESHPTPGVMSARFSDRGDLIAASEHGRAWAWSENGQWAVAADPGEPLALTDRRTGATLRSAAATYDGVCDIFFRPDGEMITAGGTEIEFVYQGHITIWDAWDDRLQVGRSRRLDVPVVAAEMSPDGRELLVAGDDGKLSLWDVATLERIADFGAGSPPLRFSADGRWIHAGGRRWRRATRPPLSPLIGRDVLEFALSPSGDRVATLSRDGEAAVYDTATGERLGATQTAESYGGLLRFAEDGTVLTLVHGQGAWVGASPAFRSSAFYYDATSTLLTDDPSGSLVLRSLGGDPILLPDSAGAVAAALGDAAYGAHEDGRIRSWTLDGKAAASAAPGFAPLQLAWSHGRLIVLGEDGVRVFDASLAPIGPTISLPDIAIQADLDGDRLLTASYDRTVRMWDARSGRPLIDSIRLAETQCNAWFLPDGSAFLTETSSAGAGAGSLRVWDSATGLPLSEPIGAPVALTGETAYGQVEFDARGTRLAARYDEGWVVTVDLPTVAAPVPGWLADVAEAFGGLALDDRNVLVPLEPEERRRRLTPPADATEWGETVRWLLQPDRLSPRSPVRVEEFVARLKRGGSPIELHLAALATPDDPDLFDRLAEAYRRDEWFDRAASAQWRARRLRD